MTDRTEKVANMIRELSAEFLARIDNHTSLITITHADVAPDIKKGTIYISVLPEDKEEQALHFIERNLGDMREFLKKNMEMKNIPYLSVKIDLGEKNRQRIDELLRQ